MGETGKEIERDRLYISDYSNETIDLVIPQNLANGIHSNIIHKISKLL